MFRPGRSYSRFQWDRKLLFDPRRSLSFDFAGGGRRGGGLLIIRGVLTFGLGWVGGTAFNPGRSHSRSQRKEERRGRNYF